ncbi:hypothetical protein [Leeuwenhoekiella sp. MAR_2009_132]|uniref:hypothetical protein n=1 Tax=Leeuwenhoekiella sp. MAR_2009_132 TaxID=1392489 RepID=UPI000B2765CA|nr:hypothetical protein [Leeuwenhoekiella sp. MAR_2009_132]
MKKIFTLLLKFIGGLLALLLLLGLYIYISNSLFLGSKSKEHIAYLKNHNTVLDTTLNDHLFDADFYNSQVFLLGEIHGYADNQTLDKTLFLFLHKKLGVTHYLAEMDSTTAGILNTFLARTPKDTSLLKNVVTAVGTRIPQQASRQLFEKWNTLYDYNLKQHDSLKIKVLGIDTSFENYDSAIPRDSAMVLNFKHTVQTLNLQHKKFYGFFGFNHVLQSNAELGKTTFATHLLASQFKTTSMVSFTLNSAMYLPKNPNFPSPPHEQLDWVNADGPLMLVKGIQDLKEVSMANSITLFKLDGAASPYDNSQDLVQIKSRLFGESINPKDDLSTTAYFQYVFLLRNSGALSRLE